MNDDNPTPPSPARPSLDKHHCVPPGTGALGMALFLIALGMLFGSSMLGYVLVRWSKTRVVYEPGTTDIAFPATAPPFGSIHLPSTLWLSTLVILASSVTMHFAIQNVRLERQKKFRLSMVLTLVLAVLFLLVQIPSLTTLIYKHFQLDTGHTMLGVIFFLVLVHALHVVGGIIPLGVITYKASRGRYNREHYDPVKHVAMYWHFLDAVWLFMFAVLLVTR